MPTNHQKTDQTYPLTPSWDPLEVALDPLDPSTSPLTSLDPLAHLYCLANHQRTYQMSALTPWDPLDIPIDSWDPRSVPSLTPLLTLRPSQITNRLVGHLYFCTVYPCFWFKAYQTVQCPLHLADLFRPIWSCCKEKQLFLTRRAEDQLLWTLPSTICPIVTKSWVGSPGLDWPCPSGFVVQAPGFSGTFTPK